MRSCRRRIPGGLGGTYAGNPIACAAALAVLDVIEDEKLLARADMIGDRIKARLSVMAHRNDTLADRRHSRPRRHDRLRNFQGSRRHGAGCGCHQKGHHARALQEGLVLLSCGVFGNVIRVLVPLTVEDNILEEGLNMLERALAA